MATEIGIEWLATQIKPGAVQSLGGLVIGPDATGIAVARAVGRLTQWAIEDGLSPQWTDDEAAAFIRARLTA